MKKINLLLLIFAAFMFTFTSCTEDPISDQEIIEIPTDIDEDMYNPLLDNIENRDDLEGGLELGCFSIDVPFSLDVDGTIVEINTFEDLENAFDFDSTDVAINVDFVYPLAITYEDGETAELADGEALGEAFALCIPDEGWETPDSTGFDGTFPAFLITELNSCYELVYPVTLQDIDGTTYVANNEEELVDLLASENFLEFVFPISLEDEDGITSAASGDELFDLLINCQEQPWDGGDDETDCPLNIGGIACYDITFPVTFSTVDGGELVINDYEELSTAFLNGNITDFVYPVTLVEIGTDESVTVNDNDELNDAIDACWEGTSGNGGGIDSTGGVAVFFFLGANDLEIDCYDVNYPVDVITMDGTQVTFDSADDIDTAFETGENIPMDLVYPVSATLTESGEVVTIESAEGIFALFENCQ